MVHPNSFPILRQAAFSYFLALAWSLLQHFRLIDGLGLYDPDSNPIADLRSQVQPLNRFLAEAVAIQTQGDPASA